MKMASSWSQSTLFISSLTYRFPQSLSPPQRLGRPDVDRVMDMLEERSSRVEIEREVRDGM